MLRKMPHLCAALCCDPRPPITLDKYPLSCLFDFAKKAGAKRHFKASGLPLRIQGKGDADLKIW